MSFRSYCLTVRPRDGISDKTSDEVVKWLTKMPLAFSVLEMEGVARHLHCQIWLDEPRARGDICKQIQRICERTISDWDASQKKVLRQGVRIAYSDWYLDYLAENSLKEESPYIIYNNPPDKTLDYYPTEEEQTNLQAMKTSVDPRFAELEIKYFEWLGTNSITFNSVCSFLANSMFVDRTMKVVVQQRDRKALALSLYSYVAKSSDVFLFRDKDKIERELEKFKSQHSNICLADSPAPFSLELPQYDSSTEETQSMDGSLELNAP